MENENAVLLSIINRIVCYLLPSDLASPQKHANPLVLNVQQLHQVQQQQQHKIYNING